MTTETDCITWEQTANPCPVCRQWPKKYGRVLDGYRLWFIECPESHRGVQGFSKEQALERWNTQKAASKPDAA